MESTGVFDTPAALDALLRWAGVEDAEAIDLHAQREAGIERLADAVEDHLDTRLLERLMGITSCAA